MATGRVSKILGFSSNLPAYSIVPMDNTGTMQDKIVAAHEEHQPFVHSQHPTQGQRQSFTYPQQSPLEHHQSHMYIQQSPQEQHQSYPYPQQSPIEQQQQYTVSPQPSVGQFPSAHPVSPNRNSQATFPYTVSTWPDPQSPISPDSPGYNRAFDSYTGHMGHSPAINSQEKTAPPAHVVDQPPETSYPKGPLLYRVMKSKWSMIACLLIGVAAAAGHHLFYNHLDGREAVDQQWMLRAGQLISFIANANFLLAALMAHQQVAWRAVGQKGFSIHAVDSLFGATHNLMELFNREAWAKSWFAMFLALYMWFSPVVIILTSATLYVVPGKRVVDGLCPSVRTLNFANEAKESYLTPKRADKETMNGRSLSSYNATAEKGNENPDAGKNDNIFEYYTSPSPLLDRIAAGVFSSGQTTYKANISKEICGDGWDCSTTVHFVGPGYKCEKLADGVGSEMKYFGITDPPFNLSTFVPAGINTYLANNGLGDYMKEQMKNLTEGGIPSKEDGPNFPKNLGVFRTEPSIWIGYAEVQDYRVEHARNKSANGWNDDYTPIIFACDHWEVNYTVTFNYTAGFQNYNITDRDYKRKIIDTQWSSWTNESTDGTADGNVAEPQENYVSPRNDYPRYRRIAAFHGLGLRFREMLAGNVTVQGAEVKVNAEIAKTDLLDRHESLPIANFQDEVRRVYEDLLISLLSDPQLLVVAWAADPSKLSGTGIGGEDTNYKCERRRETNFFDYGWSVLVAVYAVSFIIASTGVYFGIRAMMNDETNAQRVMTFSAIAKATRNVSVSEADSRSIQIRCFPKAEKPGEYEFKAELEG